MKGKLVSLAISSGLVLTAGYKLVSYANANMSGTITTDRLNVRSGPSTSYPVLGVLTKGSTVQIVEKTGEWIKINYKNSYAYISGKYVSESYNQVSTQGTISGCSYLNVRSGPGTEYSCMGVVANGDKIQILSLDSDWCKIAYNGDHGYISRKYVVINSVLGNNNSNESNSGSNNAGSFVQTKKTGIVATNVLNVRKSASTSSGILGTLLKNNNVEIVGENESWYKITYKSSYAYVSKSFVVVNNSNNSSNNGSNVGSNNVGSFVQTKKTGTITASVLNVRQNASNNSTVLGYLYKGNTVEIVGENEGWYKITYKNSYAYISKSYVTLGGLQNNGTQTVTNLNDFLFIGDSFTSRLKNTIKSNTTNAYINAEGGVYPSYWVNNFSQMPDASKVKGVVLLIGINGISQEKNLTDTKTLIDLLIQKYPGKSIYVQRVFPVGKGYAGYSDTKVADYNRNKIDTFNAKIKAYCSTKSSIVKFIDATSGFVDSNGFLINCEVDGLHTLYSYNNKFYNNIQNAVINAK